MAGLKVLQLINDNTAVALNYGVFRRKDIDSTAKVHTPHYSQIHMLKNQSGDILYVSYCQQIPRADPRSQLMYPIKHNLNPLYWQGMCTHTRTPVFVAQQHIVSCFKDLCLQ